MILRWMVVVCYCRLYPVVCTGFCIETTLTLLTWKMAVLRMCVRLNPNLPGTGVIPAGPISFNEALVVVFASPPPLPPLSGISRYVSHLAHL